jgi:hypothetical protein
MSLLRPLHGFGRVFQGLPGMLVSGQMIFFAVVHGGSAVRVGSLFVELGSSLVRVIWHSIRVLNGDFIVEGSHFPHCAMLNSYGEVNSPQQ